ncbi:UBP-type zinc finger domain-containing protein [Nocardia jejuensis]|uniref:UBP-type zinc finger domain-containing protein n=1 Tax=Nocardia jejuensis TaxID=328049 RepID=UPI000833A33D|nr:UBP-type zinc finger domain-containing protein [Nocardia jejuensis]
MAEQIEGIDTTAAPSGPGCVECEAAQGWWVHLRRCAQCGHVGCCDSSPSQHATKHFKDSGHPFVQSYEPGETWFYNFDTQEMYGEGPELVAPLHHPLDQTVPGPRDRVPSDWQQHVH